MKASRLTARCPPGAAAAPAARAWAAPMMREASRSMAMGSARLVREHSGFARPAQDRARQPGRPRRVGRPEDDPPYGGFRCCPKVQSRRDAAAGALGPHEAAASASRAPGWRHRARRPAACDGRGQHGLRCAGRAGLARERAARRAPRRAAGSLPRVARDARLRRLPWHPLPGGQALWARRRARLPGPAAPSRLPVQGPRRPVRGAEGRAAPLRYDAAHFTFAHGRAAGRDRRLGFAGFRITHPLNRPDHFDEVCSFLGASYFRALGRGPCLRPLGARPRDPTPARSGRARNSPRFTAFWLERPARRRDAASPSMRCSTAPSLTGAYRFAIAPGRGDGDGGGGAAVPARGARSASASRRGTSMFLFSPGDRRAASTTSAPPCMIPTGC